MIQITGLKISKMISSMISPKIPGPSQVRNTTCHRRFCTFWDCNVGNLCGKLLFVIKNAKSYPRRSEIEIFEKVTYSGYFQSVLTFEQARANAANANNGPDLRRFQKAEVLKF